MADLTNLSTDQILQLNLRFQGLGDRINDLDLYRVKDQGRRATGHVRLNANPADADSVTITTGTTVVIYEFDNDAAVTAGNVLVTIGNAAADTALNLANAIQANQGNLVTGARHATDTSVVDLIQTNAGETFTLAKSGANVIVQDNAEDLAQARRKLYAFRRTVTAEDVTRARLRFDTGLSGIDAYTLRIITSSADNTEIAWDGAATLSGGVLEMGNAGGVDWAASHIVVLFVWGH